MVDYYSELIHEKGLNIEIYTKLFIEENWNEMFNLSLSDDFLELVEFLYTEMGCKFYLNNYTEQMDKDLLQLLNDDKGNNTRGFKLCYKNNTKLNNFQT